MVPPYVPAKSKALKKISGSSNDSTGGGIKVSRYGKGLLRPLGSLSTAITSQGSENKYYVKKIVDTIPMQACNDIF